MGPLAPDELQASLAFSLEQAGAPQLLAPELIQTLVTHAAGNLRVLTHMAAELLTVAAERNLPQLDEALYFQVLAPAPKPRRPRLAEGTKGA